MSNHILKYIRGVVPVPYETPTIGTYWADRRFSNVYKIERFDKVPQEPYDVDTFIILRHLKSGYELRVPATRLVADFERVSRPPEESPFYFITRFFDRRKILSVQDLERPWFSFPHVYVMNGLTLPSVHTHKKHVMAQIPFPIPELMLTLAPADGSKSGKSEPIKIHGSFVPVDLTKLISIRRLVDSTDFRRAVLNEHLFILSPGYARHILKSQASIDEVKRLKQVQEFVESQNTAKRATGDSVMAAARSKDNVPPYYSSLLIDNDMDLTTESTLSSRVEIFGSDDEDDSAAEED